MVVGYTISIESLRNLLEIGHRYLCHHFSVFRPTLDVSVLAVRSICTEPELVIEALVLLELVLIELVVPS